MEKYYKEVDITCFFKQEKTIIDNVSPGDLVCIKIWNPQYIGVRELDYFGRIVKVTKYYFWIIEYCGPVLEFAFNPINECSTSQIEKQNANPKNYTKKWARSSLVSIWKADSERRVEIKEFWKSI